MQIQYVLTNRRRYSMFSPIEEGLARLAFTPSIIVEVQVVPRSMS
jgi:hypothetical protein